MTIKVLQKLSTLSQLEDGKSVIHMLLYIGLSDLRFTTRGRSNPLFEVLHVAVLGSKMARSTSK